jgi:hypothetical protein
MRIDPQKKLLCGGASNGKKVEKGEERVIQGRNLTGDSRQGL